MEKIENNIENLGERINSVNYPQDLSLIYDEANLNTQIKRYEELISKFNDIYGHKPCCITRAPGRVNLIGEHIDYEGFAVLPMAIENDIVIAISVDSKEENLENSV